MHALKALVLSLVALGVTGCGGASDSSAPPNSQTLKWTVYVSQAPWDCDGFYAMARAVQGTTILGCVSDALILNGSAAFASDGVEANTSVRFEVILGRNAGTTFESAKDLAYNQTVNVGTSNLTLRLNPTDPTAGGWSIAGDSGTTWAEGTGCPGS